MCMLPMDPAVLPLGPEVCLSLQRARSQNCYPVPEVVITHREQAPLRIVRFSIGFSTFPAGRKVVLS